MFRKEVSARGAAIAIVLILGIVQFVYWLRLVYEPTVPGTAGGGGGGPAGPQAALGLADVTVDTVVGEVPGFADGPAWKARLCGPNALAVDGDGTLLVADSRNHRIRRVTGSGSVSTVAGSGTSEGPLVGPALQARLSYPSGVALGPAGELFIADTGNHRVCRLQDGQLTLLAGGADGAADGVGAAAGFHAPGPLALGADDALWLLDAGDLRVRRVALNGAVTTPAQVPAEVRAALGESVARPRPMLLSAWPDRWSEPTLSTYSVGRRSPGVALGTRWYYADTEHGSVFMQQPGGPPVLLAGRRPDLSDSARASDGSGQKSEFATPCAVAAAPDGTLYVAEYEAHRIRRLRLPAWLLEGQLSAPARRGRFSRGWRDQGRSQRGR